jgi:uncharacterized protein YqcC (DUF446 family)
MTDSSNLKQILKDIEELCELHQKTQTDPIKCREFNSRACIFLDRMESLKFNFIVDRMMDILSGCSPKEFSHCDNHQLTKASLNRLRERVSEKIAQESLYS